MAAGVALAALCGATATTAKAPPPARLAPGNIFYFPGTVAVADAVSWYDYRLGAWGWTPAGRTDAGGDPPVTTLRFRRGGDTLVVRMVGAHVRLPRQFCVVPNGTDQWQEVACHVQGAPDFAAPD